MKSFTSLRPLRTALVLVVAVALAGCGAAMQGIANTMVVNQPELGFNPVPPAMEPIVSMPTADPELAAYLKLIGALDKDLQGVAGAPVSRADVERYYDEALDIAVKYQSQISVDNATNNNTALYRQIMEKVFDEMRAGSQYYLNVTPPGLKKDQAYGQIFMRRQTDTFQKKNVTVDLHYAFATRAEMEAKAHELVEKLRPVFAGRHGWRFLDKAQHEKEWAKVRELNNEAFRRGLVSAADKAAQDKDIWRETYDAGMLQAMYMWPSGFKTPAGTVSAPDMDQVSIAIMPMLTPQNGRYVLAVTLMRTTALPLR